MKLRKLLKLVTSFYKCGKQLDGVPYHRVTAAKRSIPQIICPTHNDNKQKLSIIYTRCCESKLWILPNNIRRIEIETGYQIESINSSGSFLLSTFEVTLRRVFLSKRSLIRGSDTMELIRVVFSASGRLSSSVSIAFNFQ